MMTFTINDWFVMATAVCLDQPTIRALRVKEQHHYY
jgi:hypothetical protein